MIAERPVISRAIAEARDKGDLSENAEYDAAREAQGMLELKISKMQDLIANAKVIDESKINTETVQMLTKVKLKNLGTGATVSYTFVGESEANILEGKPYEKDNRLMASLVTKDNAKVLLLQNEELVRQSNNINLLHRQADNYLQQLNSQRLITLLLAIVIFVITVSGMIIVSNMHRRHRLERQAFSMVVNVPVEDEPAEVAPAPEQPQITTVTPEEQAHIEAGSDARFLEKLRGLVQEQMGESSLSVETLAEQMGVSRVQLYRKVKTLTGRTPVDIIRLSRLNRSKVLLETTDKNVSEVAYEVGFTAPSYFTKCFKDEFGISPSDL